MATNFFEVELAKYERRVSKIENTPDPTKLQANRLLYRLELDQRREQYEAAKAGKPFAYTMGLEEILETMGLNCLPLANMADRAAAMADEYLALARQAGASENICDRYRMMIGMLLGQAVPPPAVVVGSSGACTVEMQMMVAAAQMFKAPHHVLDRYFDPGGERLDYLLKQLYELVDFVEQKVPQSKKFDMAVLDARIAKEAEAQRCLHSLYRAAQQVPCPMRGQDMLRIPRVVLASRPGGLEYFHALADEVDERAAKGFSALKEEKARAMWLVTSTFYDDVMKVLESRGVSVPVFCWEAMATAFGLGEGAYDYYEQHYGRKLTGLEWVVRKRSMQAWAGPAERWVSLVVEQAKIFKVDMLIYFMLSGCPSNLLDARIVAETVEKELGIPTLMIDGYMMDRAKYNADEFKAKLNEFVDYVFQRKGIK